MSIVRTPCHAKIYGVYNEEDVYLMPDYGTLTFRQHINKSAKEAVSLKEWLGCRVNEVIWLYEALDEMYKKA